MPTDYPDGNLYYEEPHEKLQRQRYQLRSSYGQPVLVGDLPHHVFMYSLYNKTKQLYKAFCSGSIIGPIKVMTSAHCFLTNHKKHKKNRHDCDVVSGSISILTQKNDSSQQWRKITKIHSQKYFRFPAYNLAVLIMDYPWEFNAKVNYIPVASVDADYDGICYAAQIRTTTAWSTTRVLFKEPMHIVQRSDCEYILQKNSRIYYCTAAKKESSLSSTGTEGAGLVCYKTNDPEETDDRGVLCGVTSQINNNLPSLHNRVGMFWKWIQDSATSTYNKSEIYILFIFICCIHIAFGNLY